ncbi:MAG: hypothetical protein ACK439_02520 [Novosphingobium sp.]|jgi:hypothetical protein
MIAVLAKDETEMVANNTVRLIAWLIVGSHAIGVAANGISLALGDPRYAPGLWLTFLLLKLAGVIAGLLLLRGRRVGAWLFTASLIAGAGVALAFTGPYPASLWMAAGLVLAGVVGGFAFVIGRNWSSLR